MAPSFASPCPNTRLPRAILALLAVVAVLVPASTAAAATPFQNAVLTGGATTYYRFTESSGTTAFNDVATGPNATYGTPGVFLGRWGADGVADKAFQLSGSGSYVTAPDAPGTSPTGDFALEAWVKPNSAVTTPQHILSKYGHHSTSGGANDEKDGYAIRTNADGSLAVYVNSGTIYPVLNSSAKLEAGRWAHVLVSADASSVKLYVNGQLDASAALVGPLTASPNPLHVGAASGPSYHRGTAVFSGRVDEVAIYDRALSAAEASDHFSKVATVPETITPPVVSGNAVPGGTVHVTSGVWSPAVAPTVTYKWKRCTGYGTGCSYISGATGQSYVVQSADANMRLSPEVTATNAATYTVTNPVPTQPVGYAGSVWGAGPASYFRLGETTGTTAKNEYPGGDGTYGSGITLGKEGVARPDTSAQFSASGAVTVPDSARTGPTGDFALEAWVRPTSIGSPQHIVSKYGHYSTTGGANDGLDGYAVRTASDGSIAVFVNNGAAAPVLNGSAKLQAGRWAHIAVSGDGPSLKLYVNGQLDASSTASPTLTRSPNPLYIGAASGPSSHRGTAAFDGRIDEVAIYDAQLTAAQVSDHFTRGVPYPETVTPPQVSGRAVPGSTLSVSAGVYSPPEAPTVTHQWQRCTSATGGCTNIAGATGSTYMAQNADAGQRLTARTTAVNAAGSAASTPQPTAQVGYAGAVVADGAGSFMRLGEASGSTAAKNEFSAAGEGTYGSGVTPGRPGIDAADTAAGFDGSGYVTGSLSGLNGPTADFAVEAWVKPSSIGGGAHLVSKYGHYSTTGGANDEADGFALRVKPDGALAMHVNSAGIVAPVLSSNEKLVPGRWYHLVASAVSTNLRIFINGRLDSSVYLPNALTRSPNPLMIGAASGPSHHRGTAIFSGRIDDVAIYDMPLSQAQVSDHFARGAPAPESITPPAISGTANDNSTLSATTGSWSPPTAPSYAYQWMACPTASGTGCDPIAGANAATYSPKKGDIGKRLMVRVTASNATGALSVDSATTAAVVSFDTTDPELTTSGPLYDGRADWLGGGVHPLHVAASDGSAAAPGSGIASVEVKVDASRAAYWSQSCPDRNCSLSRDFELSTSGLADGPHAISVIATDDAGRTTVRSWVVRTDKTKPSIDPSGEMWSERTAELRERSYALGVASSDGSAGDSSSGVRQQTLLVDGQQVDTVTQSCAAGACDLSHSFTYANSGAVAARSVTVKVTDQAGNEATKSWAFGKQPSVCADDTSPTPTPATAAETSEAVNAADDALPAAVAPSQEETVEGETVEPSVDDAAGGVAATDAIAGATIATDPNDGFAVERAGGEKVCVTPATPDATPKKGEVVNGDVVVYPETGEASDTVVRPTPTGVETFTTVKTGAAAEDYSWKVSLEGDEELRETPDGGVQVVDPTPSVESQNPGEAPAATAATPAALEDLKTTGEASADTELPLAGADTIAEQAAADPATGTVGAPPTDPAAGPTADSDEALVRDATTAEPPPESPPFDTPAGGEAAIQDGAEQAQAEVRQAVADDLAAAQEIVEANAQQPEPSPTAGATEPLVVAEFKPPTSSDADGAAVPTTLAVDGDTVTMHVDHQGAGHAYPIVADPWVTVVKYRLAWKCCRPVYRSEVRVRWESRMTYIGHWWSSLIWHSSPRFNWGNEWWSISRPWLGWVLMPDWGWSPMYMWINTPVYYTVPVLSHFEAWQEWEAYTELAWVEPPVEEDVMQVGPVEPLTREDIAALEADVGSGGDDPGISAAANRTGCRSTHNRYNKRSKVGVLVYWSQLNARFCWNRRRHKVVQRGAYYTEGKATTLGNLGGWDLKEHHKVKIERADWYDRSGYRGRQMKMEGVFRWKQCPAKFAICIDENLVHVVTWGHDDGSWVSRNYRR